MTVRTERGWCEQIAQQAAADACADWSVFALIDPASSDLDEATMSPIPTSRHAVPLKYRDLPSEMAPYLLKGEANSDFQRSQFIEWVMQGMLADRVASAPRAFRFAALIMTPQAPLNLAHSLAAAALVKDVSGATRLLRYWDPRVAQHFDRSPLCWPVLSRGVAGMWWYVDAQGQLLAHPTDGSTAPRSALTQEMHSALLHASDLNACIEFAQPDSGKFGTGHDTWSPLTTCLRVAQDQGLKGESRLRFAARRWQSGEPIELASRVQEILHASREADLPYETLQAELAPQDWLDVITEARSKKIARAQEQELT